MKRISIVLLLVASLLLSVQSARAAGHQEKKESPKKIAIRAGRLIDTRAGTVLNNAVILIEGEKITAVGKGLQITADAEVPSSISRE